MNEGRERRKKWKFKKREREKKRKGGKKERRKVVFTCSWKEPTTLFLIPQPREPPWMIMRHAFPMGACILRVTSRVVQQCERVSVFSFFLFFYIFRLLYEILYIYNEAKDVNNNRFENCVIMYIHHVLHIYSYIYS